MSSKQIAVLNLYSFHAEMFRQSGGHKEATKTLKHRNPITQVVSLYLGLAT